MNISRIDSFNQNSCVKFAGLWGGKQTKVTGAYYDTPNGVKYIVDSLEIVKQDYYPFIDENESTIEKAKQKLLSQDFHDRKIGEKFTHNVYHEFVLKDKIPISSKIYQKYIEGKLSRASENIINSILEKAHLQMFIKRISI